MKSAAGDDNAEEDMPSPKRDESKKKQRARPTKVVRDLSEQYLQDHTAATHQFASLGILDTWLVTEVVMQITSATEPMQKLCAAWYFPPNGKRFFTVDSEDEPGYAYIFARPMGSPTIERFWLSAKPWKAHSIGRGVLRILSNESKQRPIPTVRAYAPDFANAVQISEVMRKTVLHPQSIDHHTYPGGVHPIAHYHYVLRESSRMMADKIVCDVDHPSARQWAESRDVVMSMEDVAPVDLVSRVSVDSVKGAIECLKQNPTLTHQNVGGDVCVVREFLPNSSDPMRVAYHRTATRSWASACIPYVTVYEGLWQKQGDGLEFRLLSLP